MQDACLSTRMIGHAAAGKKDSPGPGPNQLHSAHMGKSAWSFMKCFLLWTRTSSINCFNFPFQPLPQVSRMSAPLGDPTKRSTSQHIVVSQNRATPQSSSISNDGIVPNHPAFGLPPWRAGKPHVSAPASPRNLHLHGQLHRGCLLQRALQRHRGLRSGGSGGGQRPQDRTERTLRCFWRFETKGNMSIQGAWSGLKWAFRCMYSSSNVFFFVQNPVWNPVNEDSFAPR